MGLDADEGFMYFSVRGGDLARLLPQGVKPARGVRAARDGGGAKRPCGHEPEDRRGEDDSRRPLPNRARPDRTRGFQAKSSFCWETGGKAPQRTWTVMADGSGLRPLYPEAPYEWVNARGGDNQKDEVAIAITGHPASRAPASPRPTRGGRRGPGSTNGAWDREPEDPRDAHHRPDGLGKRPLARQWLDRREVGGGP